MNWPGEGRLTGWLDRGETVAAFGGVLTVLGSVLPWVSGEPAATLGSQPNGPVTALLGFGVILVAVFRPWRRVDAAAVAALGMTMLLVAANALMTLGTTSELAGAGAGIGLYVVLLGGLVVVAGAAVGLVSDVPGGTPTAPRSS